MSKVWVVIPSYRPRLPQLRRLLRSLEGLDVVVVTQPNGNEIFPGDVDAAVIRHRNAELNISSWWEAGQDYARKHGATEILFLNDDCVISPPGILRLKKMLRRHGLSMVGPDYRGLVWGDIRLDRRHGPIHWTLRIPGFCFMLPADSGIRIDDSFRWFYSDDDIEWQARREWGTGLVSGIEIRHPHSGGTQIAGILEQYREEDRRKFIAKWGSEPAYARRKIVDLPPLLVEGVRALGRLLFGGKRPEGRFY